MSICGLLGKKLGHSYSPVIHQMLGNKDYRLFEKKENEIESFLQYGNWRGLNVTIPYKKTVFPFMDDIGETAEKTGSINTIIKDRNGKLTGENTDVYGFIELVRHAGYKLSEKKVLILGNGGACASVCAALDFFGARYIIISRRGKNHYGNLERHKDASFIVNTTPLGMFPHNGEAALDLKYFPKCEGVLDLIYNPARTALLLQAENLHIPHENGLYMLIAQAKKSAEFFSGIAIPDSEIDRIYQELSDSLKNIILIGMPGCGKTATGQKLSAITGRPFFDSDDEILKHFGETPESIILKYGEEKFREMETEVLANLGKQTGAIIATGGGVVTRKENYPLLHQNSTIVWLQRKLTKLSDEARPLSQKFGIKTLYAQRESLYLQFADLTFVLDTDESIESLMQKLGIESKDTESESEKMTNNRFTRNIDRIEKIC